IAGIDVHFIHTRGRTERAFPLLLLHGWPGPFREFEKVIRPLASPDDPRDAFDVVVASLPGFPFSTPPTERGRGMVRIADVMHQLMPGLGYSKYGVVGEDLGASVAGALARTRSESIVGIHLNMPYENPPPAAMKQLTDEEKAWLGEM